MTMMPAADDECPPALVAASPAVPDDCLSALPDVVESAVGFDAVPNIKDSALFDVAAVSPTGAECFATTRSIVQATCQIGNGFTVGD